MAIVTKVFPNCRDEVTNAIAKKGRTREIVKRHVTSVIPLLRPSMDDESNDPTESSKHTVKTDSCEATCSRDEIKPSAARRREQRWCLERKHARSFLVKPQEVACSISFAAVVHRGAGRKFSRGGQR